MSCPLCLRLICRSINYLSYTYSPSSMQVDLHNKAPQSLETWLAEVTLQNCPVRLCKSEPRQMQLVWTLAALGFQLLHAAASKSSLLYHIPFTTCIVPSPISHVLVSLQSYLSSPPSSPSGIIQVKWLIMMLLAGIKFQTFFSPKTL